MEKKLVFTKAFVEEVENLYEKLSVPTFREKESLSKESLVKLMYLLRNSTRENPEELPSGIRNSFGRESSGKREWIFKKLIEFLTEEGVVVSTSYSADLGYCKSYYLSDDFLNGVYTRDIEYGSLVISDKTFNELSRKVPSEGYLLDIYNSHNDLTIDLDRVKDLSLNLRSTDFIKFVNGAADIHYKKIIYTVEDERTGRVFNTFNGIMKGVRNICSYKGQEMMNIDLRSSQPYFLASILRREYGDIEEVRRFYSLIIETDLYNWLGERLGLYDIEGMNMRDFLKKELFRYIYKDPRGSVLAEDIMKKEFPIVHKIINDRKKRIPLWLELQKTEADIFMGTVREFLGRGIYGVHDGLYFPIDLFEDVFMDLRKRFSLLGFSDYVLINSKF